jgi:hypothetical protein
MSETNTQEEIFKKFFCELAIINIKIREKCKLSEDQTRMLESLNYMIPIIYKFKENPNIKIEDIIDENEKNELFKYSNNLINNNTSISENEILNKPQNLTEYNNSDKNTVKTDITNKYIPPALRSVEYNNKSYPSYTSSYITNRYKQEEEDTNTDEISDDDEGDQAVENFTNDNIFYLNKRKEERWIIIEEFESDDESFESADESFESEESSDESSDESISDESYEVDQTDEIDSKDNDIYNDSKSDQENEIKITYGDDNKNMSNILSNLRATNIEMVTYEQPMWF